MRFQIFNYSLQFKGRDIAPDKHFEIFNRSKGSNNSGEFTEYRGRKDAVLMQVEKIDNVFTGLIGKHNSERLVRKYSTIDDILIEEVEQDDDYPYAIFYCDPRRNEIAISKSSDITVNSAIGRITKILYARTSAEIVFTSIVAAYDLRAAIKSINIRRVDFEIYQVNPHTKDLGLSLDENKKKDFIDTLMGSMTAERGKRLRLNGGFLSATQQLQESGHAVIGYTGDIDGIQIQVPKKKLRAKPKPLDEDETKEVNEVTIDIGDEQRRYPLSSSIIGKFRNIFAVFRKQKNNEKR